MTALIADTRVTPRVQPLSTPRLLRGLLAALALATAVFWGAAGRSASRMQRTVQTVGRDSVPSIVAAEEIRAALASAHAVALRAALAPPGEAAAAWKLHQDRLSVAADRLVFA